jgi:hypothetical protein
MKVIQGKAIACVEYTDTFGGDANYCWVQRHEFDATNLSDLAVMRRAKALCGLSGNRGVKDEYGEDVTFRPYGMATIMFISYRFEPND